MVDRHLHWLVSEEDHEHQPKAALVRIIQIWEQVSKHERGMRLEVIRPHRPSVGTPAGGGPSKKRGLREGVWTLSEEQIDSTCRLVKDARAGDT